MAAERRKLIVVSNRGPVSFGRGAGGERTARRGGGGLVTALRSLVSHHDVTWIASAITEEDRAVAADGPQEETARDGSPYRLRLVAHDPRAYDWYYNVVANPTLWFLQHYLWNLAAQPNVDSALHSAWEQGYTAVNRGFAAAVLEELEREPDATVFFHDYHLYVAPRLVRDAAPDATLAHFIHIPWAQPDYWRVLPEALRTAIHDGLLANDVIGFHTSRWQSNFLGCARDLAGATVDAERGFAVYGGHTALVSAHAISVDPQEFDELAESEAVLEAGRDIVHYRPEKLILRVDRTDPSKNVVRGFLAFELFLEAHHEWHGRVIMVSRLDPSRQDIPEYAEYLGAIQRAARRVNDRFQDEDWTPIWLEIADDFARSVAAYKEFDVLLVNPIFDGLNLVAKEAPLVNTRDGVLVLSENAGVHEELGTWALTINPFDVAGQAAAIHQALEMPQPERRRRIEAIRAHVRAHDLEGWIAAQLADLDRVRSRPRRALARLRRAESHAP
ncbi:MAG TPA: trehalose-6-phosphate synthase, partial [Gaiellaceae bacterium]|nr:trehalose-6-phosphate synthase [Gaiellaceae bacterium]